MKFELKKNNIKSLYNVINLAIINKHKRVDISVVDDPGCMPQFSEVIATIYEVLDSVTSMDVKLLNFPFCALSEASHDHIFIENCYVGEKNKSCKKCKYRKICKGFPSGYVEAYGEGEFRPIKDLPIEVMIEIESRCNLECRFCFNRNSFAKKSRDIRNISKTQIKRIINDLSQAGVEVVRFTGGEPLLRKDIYELIDYANKKLISVWLNTNGLLVNDKNLNKFKGKLENVLVPIESDSSSEEDRITGGENSLSKKIKALKLFKQAKVPRIRVGTVINKNIIKNFESFANFILNLPIDEWELYRPITNRDEKIKLAGEDVKKLAEKIEKINFDSKIPTTIANCFPFCMIDSPELLDRVSRGALFEDGHNRVVLDPRGFYKPHYFIDKNIGGFDSVISAWNSKFMSDMRNLKFLPKKCAKCRYGYKCRGGSRYEAFAISGSWSGDDPLAKYKII